MELRAVHAQVRGIVQGVGFRWFVLRQAREIGVRGHTRNLPDGSVEVVAVGSAAEIDALLEQLRTGPDVARVDALEWHPLSPVPSYEAFEIRS